MNRRDFLGKILGSFVTLPTLNYIAKDLWSKEVIETPKLILPQYKTCLRLNDGTILQGTGIVDITYNNNTIYLKQNDIDVKYEFTAKGIIIFDTKNKPLVEKDFIASAFLMPRDILKSTYDLCIHSNHNIEKIVNSLKTNHYGLEKLMHDHKLEESLCKIYYRNRIDP